MSAKPNYEWPPHAPTPQQLEKFFAEVASGRVTGHRLDRFLKELDEGEAMLDLMVEQFFTKDRLAPLVETHGSGVVTRAINVVEDWRRSQEQNEITMGNFLNAHKNRADIARMPNAGKNTADLIVRAILQAHLPFDE